MVNYFLIFLFSLFCVPSFAVTIHTKVSKNPVALNEDFNFIIEIVSDDMDNIETPELPKTLPPLVLRGANTSTQVTQSFNIPGGSSREVKRTFYYTLYCAREGVWDIDPIVISIKGKKYQTQKISVKVSSQVQPSQKNPSQNPLFNQSFGLFDFFKQPQFPSLGMGAGDDLLLKVISKKKKIFLGEMFPLQWFLYKKRNSSASFVIENIQTFQPEGFWLEKSEQPSQLEFKQVEQIQGKSYLKALAVEYVLFPLKTGFLTIDSVQMQVRTRSFPSFFSQTQDQTLKSRPLKIQISPLPQLGKGVFTGAVGSFLIQSQLDRKDILKSDILSYKIHFTGTGGVHNIQLPKWPEDSDFEVYNILESQKFSIEKSSKVFEILLLAEKSGSLVIPSFVWTTFDPQLQSYVSHELPEHTVNVRPLLDSKKEESSQRFFSEKEQEPKTELRQESFLEKFSSYYKKYKVFLFALLFFICAFVLWNYRRVFLKKRKKNLEKILLTACKRAVEYKNKNQVRKAGVELLGVMDQIWEALTGERGRDVSVLLEKSPPSVRKEFGASLSDLIQKLEFLSFAPEDSQKYSEEEVEKIIQECESLVQKILKYYK